MRSVWVSGAMAMMVAYAAPAEAKTTVTLQGVEVTSASDGADATSVLAKDAAKSAVESRLQWAEACGEVEDGGAFEHKVALTVDGNGAVTEVKALESKLPEAIASCIDGVLKEVKTSALATPETTVVVTVTLVIGSDDVAVAPSVPPEMPAVGAAEVAPAPAPAVETAPVAGAPETEGAAPGAEAAQAPSASPVAGGAGTPPAEEEDAKPWRVSATLNQSLGIGTFVDSRYGYYGYAMTLGGSYDLSELFRLSARVDFDQELTQSLGSRDAGYVNEFYFRETRLSASTRNLWKDEEYTGIGFNAVASLRLPTDLAGQMADRIFGLVIGGTFKRTFENLGPGSLDVSWSPSYRENFGPRAGSFDQEDVIGTAHSLKRVFGAELATGPANTARQISNSLTLSYTFLEDFTATVDFAVANYFLWDVTTGGNGQLPDGRVYMSSTNAIGGGGRADLMVGTIELAYQINKNFSTAVGLLNQTDPFVRGDDGQPRLRNPFIDVSTSVENRSVFYVDFGFSY